ncbi:AsmA protein [Elusimicrobium posterum]|uniref:AsmA family protein n=1 Tax=Elusimicrobium posterum TaxID=3116653 RepID=UPI003C77C026
MIKKLLKFLAVLALIVFVLIVAAGLVLRYMFPPERVKEMVTEYAKTTFDREVTFDDVSFRIIGVDLENFAISEKGTFANGTFAKAESLVIKVAIMPLLKKTLEIDTVGLVGFDANIIKNKDGSFNFSDLIPEDSSNAEPVKEESAPAQESTGEMNFSVDMRDFYITNSGVSYIDKQAGFDAQIKEIHVKINNFNLTEAFDMDASMKLAYENPAEKMSVTVPVTSKFTINLQNFSFDDATVEIKKLAASLNGANFDVTGDVKNFNNPQVNVALIASNITQRIADGIVADIPSFTLPTIKTTAKIAANLEKSTANVSEYKVNMGTSTVNGKADVNWGGKDLLYNVTAAFNFVLSELANIVPQYTADFGIGGKVTGNVSANQALAVKGTVNMENVQAGYQNVVKAKDINGKMEIKSLENISTNTITGKINDSAFKTDLAVLSKKKDNYAVTFNFDLDALTIKELPKMAAAEETTTAAQPAAAAKTATAASPLMLDLKTNVKVGKITVPFFTSEGFTLATNLTGIDADATLKKTNGSANFKVEKGAITDVDTFLASNKVVKVLFFSVGVIKKAFSFLKLDQVLFPKDEKTQTTNYNAIPYEYISGDYAFTNGLMTLKDSTLNSSLTDVKASGTVDFPKDNLNMKINTVIAKQTVAINVKGTMEDPKISLDALSTAAALIPGIAKLGGSAVTGTASTATGVVSGTATTAKDAVSSVINIFKKKDTSATEEEKK